MSLKIQFDAIRSVSTFLDPRHGFEPKQTGFEVRKDPLTGRTSHYSHFGAIKPQKLDVESYTRPDIKGFCPFCPENKEKYTPKFTADLYPEGRPSLGEATLIPNLFPYDIYSGVVIMADYHLVPLQGFNVRNLANAFTLGIGFLKTIKRMYPDIPYHLMAWNYMPPSGGGLVHPHQQYFATEYPGNQFVDEFTASERFYLASGKDYWAELIGEEKRAGKRYIGDIGASCWLVPFACLGVLGDILCIFPDIYSIEDFTDNHIGNLVAGLLKVFQYYLSSGIMSFNASLFLGPGGQRFFPCHLRIAARTFLNMRDCAPDLNFFQALLGEPVCVTIPEELCTSLGEYFDKPGRRG